MIDRKGLAARAKRLKELGAGLHKELLLWERMLWTGQQTPEPTTALHHYLRALRLAISAIAEAREAMAKLSQRSDD